MHGPWLLAFAVGCGPVERLVGERGDAPDPVPTTRFGLPVADRTLISSRIGVDHDPEQHEGIAANAYCTDYAGRAFPHCYDEHHGTDLILDGGFDRMDAGSLEVVAAFQGVVVDAVDGNYDRCHTHLGEVTCDGNPIRANYVILEHPDGVRSLYWHMANGSVQVEIGDEVACGDTLGLVGSSGNSSMPHLHFEAELEEDEWIDPFAGSHSQRESLWDDQGDDDALPEDGCSAR